MDDVGADGFLAPRVPRLINRPRPVPLESLDSLVQRLRWANHYDTEASWLRSLVPRLPTDLNTLRRPEHVRALSMLTGLDSTALVELTLHRFAPRYQEPGLWPPPLVGAPEPPEPSPAIATSLWGGGADAIGRGATAVCPRCWREQRALLLPWSLVHLTACRRHRILLLDRCPRCGWGLRLDVRSEACPHCGRRIATMRAVSIAAHPDSVALTEALWSATGCAEGRFPPASVGLAAEHPLRRVGTPSLLRALASYAEELLVCANVAPLFAPEGLLPGAPLQTPDSWYYAPRLEGVDLVTRHHGLVAAWRLLRDWDTAWSQVVRPTGLVEASRSGAGAPYPVTLVRSGQGPHWILAETAWLRVVWDHTASGYPWRRADLPAYPAAPWEKWLHAWRRQDLILTLAEAAAYAQLSEGALVALVRGGVLPCAYPLLANDPATWRFSERGLYHAFRALLGHLPVRPFGALPVPAVDLAWVLGYAERMGVGLAAVLQGVGDGSLPAARTRPTVQLIDVWFDQRVAMAYLEEHQQPVRRRPQTAWGDWLWRLVADSPYGTAWR